MRHVFAIFVSAILGTMLISAIVVDKRSDFDSALLQAERMIDVRKCKEAKTLLQAKLAENSGQDYVREKLTKVRELLKRASFEAAFPRKGVEDIFCGEVVSFDKKSGQIELHYKKPDENGAEKSKDAPKKDASFACGDFENVNKERVLKLPFAGPHTIELDGKAMDQINPVVRMGFGNDITYRVTYDFGSLSKIEACAADGAATIASSSTFSNVTRPYKIKVAARDKQIDASHNGKRIVLADRPDPPTGRVGYAQFANLEEIRVSGAADLNWINEKIDALTKADLAEFEKGYDAEADLPEWLRAGH